MVFTSFDGSSSPMVRTSDADSSEEFTINKTVQVLESSEEGISGAKFQYQGIDQPTVGTNVLPFALVEKGVVGNNSIDEAKLTTTLANKINAKADRFEQTAITLVAGSPFTVNHNLGIGVPMYGVYDSLNNEIGVEFDIIDSNSITIKSSEALNKC